ncbi:MAG: hypothetical protein GF370_02910 [Candidatus Nealsonbacteria bacterium]|nr:hypothetical protein [Candidatus Nealsonbacteria bacterium]
MGKIISQEEIERIKELPGKVRGATLRAYGDFIRQKEGEEGLNLLEDKMSELGFENKLGDMKAMEFYPVSLQGIVLELISKLFNYDNQKYQEMGRFSAKFSLVVRMFMKYFFSEEQMQEKGPQIWKKSYTVGDFELAEYNEEEKRVVLKLKNFKLHPMHGQVLIGYFASVLQMIGGNVARGTEVKSPFKGDKYYEFLMEW